MAEAVAGGILQEKMFVKISDISQRNTSVWSLFLITFRPVV